jgi:hypothetical protein
MKKFGRVKTFALAEEKLFFKNMEGMVSFHSTFDKNESSSTTGRSVVLIMCFGA